MNNFKTKEKCLGLCANFVQANATEQLSQSPEYYCLLQPVEGICFGGQGLGFNLLRSFPLYSFENFGASVGKYYYDVKLNRCFPFKNIGCNSNRNSFSGIYQCLQTCKRPDSFTPDILTSIYLAPPKPKAPQKPQGPLKAPTGPVGKPIDKPKEE